MIKITSDAGRIGPLWWINSDTRPVHMSLPARLAIKTGNPLASDLPRGETDFLFETKMTRWGTFGFGFNVRIAMAPCD
jgi:hypothetical protein